MLVDKYGRTVDYLRISVTDRCNLRCIYCMPPGGVKFVPHDEILRYEEIIRVIKTASDLGIKRFRITGGEPLLRKGIIDFIKKLGELKVNFSLTTNGYFLKKYAKILKASGIKRINIGLPTLKKEKYQKVTRGGDINEVFKGIDTALSLGIRSVKINVVVMNKVNDNEMENFIKWAKKTGVDVRFIEYMVLFGKDYFLSLKEKMEEIAKKKGMILVKIEGSGPSKNFKFRDSEVSIGFILPRSEKFCFQCNRLRLTADGRILPCLFSKNGFSLKNVIREKGDIGKVFKNAVMEKPKDHKLGEKKYNHSMIFKGG